MVECILKPPETLSNNSNLYSFIGTDGETSGFPAQFNTGDDYGGDYVSDLKEWFARPQLLKRLSWSEGTSLNSVIYPWAEFFTSTRVREKIKGYQKLRANLHIKVLVNATPFQYSKVLVSYKPMVWGVSGGYSSTRTPDIETKDFGGGLIDFDVTAPDYFIPLSQRTHLDVYPCQCKGGDMTLPFIWMYNWLDLTTKKTDGTDTVFEVLSSMGRLYLDSYFPLRTASTTSTQPINISIYAWATDVELAGPTLQQGGNVERTATAIAEAAGKLSKAPVIGPYAAPVQGLMSIAAATAKAFGWSNPPHYSAANPVVQAPLVGLANPELSVLGEKLTMDPDNGLSIDPGSVGIPQSQDDLAITNFCSRESYLTQFDWKMTDSPDAILFNAHVNPALADMSTRTTSLVAPFNSFPASHMVPMALPSQHFKYWSGSITYIFEVIGSQMHRGRLRLSYDPAGPAIADSTGRLITRVFDLTEATKFEFTVPWMADAEFLTNDVVSGSSSADRLYGIRGASYKAYTDLSYNGGICLSVLNELASTSSSADCRIIVSVRGGPDLRFAYPMDIRAAVSGTQTYSNPIFQQQSGLPYDVVAVQYTNPTYSSDNKSGTFVSSLVDGGFLYTFSVNCSSVNSTANYHAALCGFNKDTDPLTHYAWTTANNSYSSSTGLPIGGTAFTMWYKDLTGTPVQATVEGHFLSITSSTIPAMTVNGDVTFGSGSAIDKFCFIARTGATGPWRLLGPASANASGCYWSITGSGGRVPTYSGSGRYFSVLCSLADNAWNEGYKEFAVIILKSKATAGTYATLTQMTRLDYSTTGYVPPPNVWSMKTNQVDKLMIQQAGDIVEAPDDVVDSEVVPAQKAGRGEKLVYMGESVVSIRNLFHRSFMHSVIPIIPSDTLAAVKSKLFLFALKIPRMVRPYGLDYYGTVYKTWGSGATSLTSRYNLARSNPLHDFLQCFLAYKGSMVYKFVDVSANIPVTWDSNTPGSTVNYQGIDHLVITHSHQRRPFASSTDNNPFKFSILDNTTALAQADAQFGFMPISESGVAHSVFKDQKHLTVVIPDYNKYKFHSANLLAQSKLYEVVDVWRQTINPWVYDEAYQTIDIYGKGAMAQNVQTTGTSLGPNATACLGNGLQMLLYFHPGEDFNAFMFLNVPTSYRYKLDVTTNVWLAQ